MIGSEDEARAFVAERCDQDAIARLDLLVDLLRSENSRQNLVAASSLDQVWTRHIADSAQLIDHVPRGTNPWLDLGTGAGFPGVVIAAMSPELEVVLVESRKRRIEWLGDLIAALGLSRCRVEGKRLETVGSFNARVISARAFAPLPTLLELASRFSTSDTWWLLPKGRSAAQEVTALPFRMNGMFHVEQSQTSAEAGIVVGRVAGHTGR
jgi:16S rRNA (guanine527-N7)-methyltransferase